MSGGSISPWERHVPCEPAAGRNSYPFSAWVIQPDCFASLAMTDGSLRGARRATKQSTVTVRPVVASVAKQPLPVPRTDVDCAPAAPAAPILGPSISMFGARDPAAPRTQPPAPRRVGTEYGFAIFQERCVTCHDNPDALQKAPEPGALSQMTPEAIHDTLPLFACTSSRRVVLLYRTRRFGGRFDRVRGRATDFDRSGRSRVLAGFAISCRQVPGRLRTGSWPACRIKASVADLVGPSAIRPCHRSSSL